MKDQRYFFILTISIALFLVSCEPEDEECLVVVNNEANTFTWAATDYDISANSTSNFVLCTDNEIDAFWAANTSSEITFGFEEVKAAVTVSLDENGMPSPEIILTQGSSTYAAVSGTLAPCDKGFKFSLLLKRLSNPDDLSTTTGADNPLTGFLQCP